MKKNVYTINGKRIVQGDQNILNDHEININNLSEIWYYRFPKGTLQDVFDSACLEAYLINSACLVRGEDLDEDTPLMVVPISVLVLDPESHDVIEKVDGLMVPADMPLGAFYPPLSYRELPKFVAENLSESLSEKLKQYRCSREDFYKINSK